MYWNPERHRLITEFGTRGLYIPRLSRTYVNTDKVRSSHWRITTAISYHLSFNLIRRFSILLGVMDQWSHQYDQFVHAGFQEDVFATEWDAYYLELDILGRYFLAHFLECEFFSCIVDQRTYHPFLFSSDDEQ